MRAPRHPGLEDATNKNYEAFSAGINRIGSWDMLSCFSIPSLGLEEPFRYSVWAIAIIKSKATGAERHKRWPKVFATKYLTKSYKMKGRASKSLSGTQWHSDVGFAN